MEFRKPYPTQKKCETENNLKILQCRKLSLRHLIEMLESVGSLVNWSKEMKSIKKKIRTIVNSRENR